MLSHIHGRTYSPKQTEYATDYRVTRRETVVEHRWDYPRLIKFPNNYKNIYQSCECRKHLINPHEIISRYPIHVESIRHETTFCELLYSDIQLEQSAIQGFLCFTSIISSYELTANEARPVWKCSL